MTVLNFKNKEQADSIAGILDFSLNLIDPKAIKKLNKEMFEYASKLKNDLIYQQDENVMYLKDEEVLFVIDNAIWILTEEIKEKHNEIYSNSIELMKQLQNLIQDKQKIQDENRFTVDGNRKYDKELQKKYLSSYNREYLITRNYIFPVSLDIPKHKLPVMPKEGEIWILSEYKEAEGFEDNEEPIEDSVIIVNKLTNKKCEVLCSEFEKLSELND